jgi:carbon monoxide dehydrogenase subunit G
MIVDQRVTINAPIDRAWDFLMDIPAVSKCVPGVESIEEIDKDNYIGALKVRVGPIGVKLEGKVTVAERDAEQKRAQLNVEAADRRIRGAVNGKTTMHLEEVENGTDLVVHTDVSILGKLGEFGQAVMRKKADQIIRQFAQNVSRELEGSAAR